MPARFRIRTSQGQELSFASREIFAEFVRSGELSPDDVVYDAETREWSSARTHPVVLQIELEEEKEETESEPDDEVVGVDAGVEEGDEDDGLPAGEASGEGADIGLDLAPLPQGMTPEQEAAAFVAKMEAERAADLDRVPEEPSIESFMVDATSSSVSGGETEAPPPPPPPPPPPSRPTPTEAASRGDREAGGAARSQPEPPTRARSHEKPKRRERKKKKSKAGAGRKLTPFLIAGVAVVAAAVYFGPELLAPTGEEGGENVAADTTPPEPPPLIPDTEEALRRRAQERFLASTQALLRGLEPIPDIWLHGQYLAAPSDYPHVREVWESYLTTIQQVRAGDDDRYRAAYLRALDDARIQGSARTLRLAAAAADFRADSAGRDAFYDRVEALATAALQGHDALVEAEGTISYEPAAGPRVSADPVIEAAGRNEEAQALLDQVLDLILGQLHAEGGPGESRNVREWVQNGILSAVTG